MTGGLLQLSSYSSQELFLTGSPTITFFRVIYKKHTNFSTELIKVDFDNLVDFGSTSSTVIPKYGDLLNTIYVSFTLPNIDLDQLAVDTDIDQNTTRHISEINDKFRAKLTSFISHNNRIAGQIQKMIAPHNINPIHVMSLVKTYPAYKQLLQSSEELELFITSHDLRLIGVTSHDIDNILRYIPVLNVINRINTIIAEHTQEPTAIREKIIDDINNRLYPITRDFYMPYYRAILDTQELANTTVHQEHKFAWTKEVGNFIIDHIDVTIGSNVIDSHTGSWISLAHHVYHTPDMTHTYDKMIGNIRVLTEYDSHNKPEYRLYIPLQFWFCRHSGLALPIISLAHHDITIDLKLHDLTQVARFSSAQIQKKLDISLGNPYLLVEYIFLDIAERNRFSKSSHEYLIETVQHIQINDIEPPYTSTTLPFTQPTKFIMWYAQPMHHTHGLTGSSEPKWNQYTPAIQTYIETNSYRRTNPNIGPEYYNYVQPYWHFNNYLPEGVYSYSFAINPTEYQPSGTINMSRIKDFDIITTLDDHHHTRYSMSFFAVSYNILRFISGMAGLAFHNF